MSSIDPAIVEFANEALYLAFNNRDLEQMQQLWAEDHSCVCIHPGWQPIYGREEILESWQQIFVAQQASDQITCYLPRVITGGDVYTVCCYEQLQDGWLVATNSFVMEQGRVRIFYHHAGQCLEPPEVNLDKPVLQ